MKPSHGLRASRGSFIVVAAIFLWLAATAWLRPLMTPDEGRYAGVAFEMLRSGDWLVPRLDGLPFFHKPPLFYWIAAAAMTVLGPSEWAARLPSILGGTLAAASLFLFLRRWAGHTVARLSAVVLVTMPFFFAAAQFANLDMLVAGCISATVLLAAHAALSREQEGEWRGALAAAYAFAALGVLAKGLIGLMLPALVFLAWTAATRRLQAARLMAWLPGWGVLIATAGPWLIAMQWRYPAFFDYFIVTQHFRRFATSGFNNAHPFWFYLPVIAGLTVPWIAWLLVPRKGPRTLPRTRDLDWLMTIWWACIVVFFSLPRSKLIGYVLPALPPLAYLVARAALAAAGERGLASHPLRWTAALAGLACVGAIVAVESVAVQPRASIRLPSGETVAPDDQVLMLDAYYYEVPIHWSLREAVMVSSDWSPEAVDRRDDWRRELRDAGRFDAALASRLLVAPSRLGETLCVPRATWVIGATQAPLAYPWLAEARPVAANAEAAIWRFEGSATRDPRCLETPTADSPQKSALP
jgi:4-amino-4-deoxy-L-arabinose transferase-like glycosyltransferase